MENTHSRVIAAPADEVGRLLDRLASADDPLWPSPAWVPMRLDRPLGVGATGGHGRVRYTVTAYEPGRRVEFAFDPRIGMSGTHTFTVEPDGPDRCVLRHHMTGRASGAMRLLWPAVIRNCHDTVLEHLLDNASLAATGDPVAEPVRYPLRARLVVRAATGRVEAVPVPPHASLLHAALPSPDLADAYAVRLHPGTTTDPREWADKIFRDPPRAVSALLRLRNAVVAPFGIERGDRSAFDVLASASGEALLGTDAAHLDFRASVLVEPGADGTRVTLSTHATARSRSGRIYLGLVRLAHPAVVRAMLRRAAINLSRPAPSVKETAPGVKEAAAQAPSSRPMSTDLPSGRSTG
ncbi:DUF2867 domain-containing protein [Actinoplanes sp. NPDC051861]|uniref:DUF2867 domain-containing protein n=1 Tax=Actinoplanes sp. NPDC051861 TaxID=3155170 RepID=UPI00342A6D47